MENQTAVEWAEDNLAKLNSAVVSGEITAEQYHEQRVRLWEYAKDIHKKQIEYAYLEGGCWDELPQPRFDNYYNSNYGKTN